MDLVGFACVISSIDRHAEFISASISLFRP
jgi:hypothetical protein